MNYAYSPDTGELINTTNPAPWMGTTTVAPPAFNPAIAGCFWRNGAWVVVSSAPSAAQLLSDAQNSAYAAIDAQAGATRSKYITTVPGQPETYMSKAADAAAYKAAAYPFASIANYLWVQAEAVAINGASPTSAQVKAAADGILAAQATWITLGAQIEQTRRAGAVAVAAATTAAVAQSARDAAMAALKAL
jgi:hypothetical protein